MNPAIATAGCNLMDLARESVQYSLDGDDDAKVAGGVGKEMERLVGFTSATEGRVDHVKGDDYDYDDDDETTKETRNLPSSLFRDLKIQNTSHTSKTLKDNADRDHRLDNVAMLSVLDSVMEYNTLKATEESVWE